MNNFPSGPQMSRDAAMPVSSPCATKMSRTSVRFPESSRPRANATVTPGSPSTTIGFEYVR